VKITTRIYTLILIYAILLISLITFRGELISLSIPLILYLFTGWLGSPSPENIKISVDLGRTRVSEGELVDIQLQFENCGEQVCLLKVQQSLPPELIPIGDSPDILTSLKPGENFEKKTIVKCARGIHSLGEITLLASDPLGSHFKQEIHHSSDAIHTLPIPRTIRNIKIRPRRTKVYAGTIPANRGGIGNEFFSVRTYSYGDSLQRINWRASARHESKYFINLFQQERVAEVAVLVDARSQSNILSHSVSVLNYSVQAAATVANSLLATGNRVGLLSFGSHLEWTFPGYGRIQRERILHALAKVRTGESQIFNELKNLPVRLFPAQSQLILISPLLNEDFEMLVQLRARGYPLLVISPNLLGYLVEGVASRSPTARMASRLATLERNLLLRKLGQAGILVLPWDIRRPVEDTLNRFHRSPTQWIRSGVKL
jgi:uncharacterized protein (DUF58 family)